MNGCRSMGFEAPEIKHLKLLLHTTGMHGRSAALTEQVKLQRVDGSIRLKNGLAMFLQRLGCSLAALGCKIYNFESISAFAGAAFRKTCKILFGKGDGKKQGNGEQK